MRERACSAPRVSASKLCKQRVIEPSIVLRGLDERGPPARATKVFRRSYGVMKTTARPCRTQFRVGAPERHLMVPPESI